MTIKEKISFIKETMNETFLDKYNLTKLGWNLEISKSTRILGQSRCTKSRYSNEICNKRLRFSKFYLEYCNDDELLEIILHEIAHAIDMEQRGYSDHSMIWGAILYRIGGRNLSKSQNLNSHKKYYETVANYRKAYLYRCPVCGNESIYYRKIKRSRSCGKCSSKYNEQYKLELVN